MAIVSWSTTITECMDYLISTHTQTVVFLIIALNKSTLRLQCQNGISLNLLPPRQICYQVHFPGHQQNHINDILIELLIVRVTLYLDSACR